MLAWRNHNAVTVIHWYYFPMKINQSVELKTSFIPPMDQHYHIIHYTHAFFLFFAVTKLHSAVIRTLAIIIWQNKHFLAWKESKNVASIQIHSITKMKFKQSLILISYCNNIQMIDRSRWH